MFDVGFMMYFIVCYCCHSNRGVLCLMLVLLCSSLFVFVATLIGGFVFVAGFIM